MVSTKLRLRELLVERRWTIKRLSGKTGLSESYLTHLKNGTRRWNEDTLARLAVAFGLDPTDIFAFRTPPSKKGNKPSFISERAGKEDVVTHIPIIEKIPSHPAELSSDEDYAAVGFTGFTFPAFNMSGKASFGLRIKEDVYEPFLQVDDMLVFSPEVWSKTGDLVATEFYSKKEEKLIIALARVNYLDDFVLIECIHKKYKNEPLALIRGKDHFRVIGKVIARYQKY